MSFPLVIKENDLFVKETLSYVVHYMKHGSSIDKENVERHIAGKPIVPTYRIRNNRIVLKEIRGKLRFFVQMVLEGVPVVKRKKNEPHQLHRYVPKRFFPPKNLRSGAPCTIERNGILNPHGLSPWRSQSRLREINMLKDHK